MDFFKAHNYPGIAFRQRQTKYKRRGAKGKLKTAYSDQHCDILVLSPRVCIAIECKSVGPKTTRLYWSQHFHGDPASDSFQLNRLNVFCNLSGCKGIVAIETRHGPGRPRTMSLIPLNTILGLIDQGHKGLYLDERGPAPIFHANRTTSGYTIATRAWFACQQL